MLLSPRQVRERVQRNSVDLVVAGRSPGVIVSPCSCVRSSGTLAPWSPPTRLVVSGLYRVSRNPMYVAVLLIVAGWALLFRSRAIGIYAAVLMLAFHARVVWGEEPWLARTHGTEWAAYASMVPRWLGWPQRTLTLPPEQSQPSNDPS